jgi:hypothetical protein
MVPRSSRYCVAFLYLLDELNSEVIITSPSLYFHLLNILVLLEIKLRVNLTSGESLGTSVKWASNLFL